MQHRYKTLAPHLDLLAASHRDSRPTARASSPGTMTGIVQPQQTYQEYGIEDPRISRIGGR